MRFGFAGTIVRCSEWNGKQIWKDCPSTRRRKWNVHTLDCDYTATVTALQIQNENIYKINMENTHGAHTHLLTDAQRRSAAAAERKKCSGKRKKRGRKKRHRTKQLFLFAYVLCVVASSLLSSSSSLVPAACHQWRIFVVVVVWMILSFHIECVR